MRRREFEIVAYLDTDVYTGKPGFWYKVIDKQSRIGRIFQRRHQHVRYRGPSPAECHQWIERYRQAEKDVAAFNG